MCACVWVWPCVFMQPAVFVCFCISLCVCVCVCAVLNKQSGDGDVCCLQCRCSWIWKENNQTGKHWRSPGFIHLQSGDSWLSSRCCRTTHIIPLIWALEMQEQSEQSRGGWTAECGEHHQHWRDSEFVTETNLFWFFLVYFKWRLFTFIHVNFQEQHYNQTKLFLQINGGNLAL